MDNLITPTPVPDPSGSASSGPPATHSFTCAACATGIDTFAAWGLAGSFARNLLSWDQENPDRWARVLTRFLPDDMNPWALGYWDGNGRQRVDCVLPERVIYEAPGQATVRVRVWIVPYSRSPRAAAGPGPAGPPPLIGPTVESSVPPAAAAGWRGHDTYEALLGIPIMTDDHGGVVIDAKRLIPTEPDSQP